MSCFMGGCEDLDLLVLTNPSNATTTRAESKAASLLTTLPGSTARKTGCIKWYPANPMPHLKMPDKPSDPETAGRNLTTGS